MGIYECSMIPKKFFRVWFPKNFIQSSVQKEVCRVIDDWEYCQENQNIVYSKYHDLKFRLKFCFWKNM